ncbi:hypothetical protein TM48_02734 [Mycobacterium shottsii]|uniref:Uncharacterized protein n=1 Tax=Mycobacterium shottsii TaxID=133549 RepID=A0A7I7LFH1_9MYCO|nr:hypothetical protein [Mycobacterium shottsii]QYL28412.1 hypothetical protein TM48_02734 [Mycobacterium shottsii]BBX58360.1 hypothetical protein MSHO_37050 [Mycobacterium shottsii]
MQPWQGGIGGGLLGLIGTGETLASSLAGGVSGLLSKGESLLMIWQNATAEVTGALSDAVVASIGVGLPGLSQAAVTLSTGIANASVGLTQTG